MMTKKHPPKEEPQIKHQDWQSLPGTKPERGAITRIVIKYDVGFGNQLFIRGKGAGLNWDKGVLLKNSKADEWVWESSLPFSSCEFKILFNDKHYEQGENHPLICGSSVQYTPKF